MLVQYCNQQRALRVTAYFNSELNTSYFLSLDDAIFCSIIGVLTFTWLGCDSFLLTRFISYMTVVSFVCMVEIVVTDISGL